MVRAPCAPCGCVGRRRRVLRRRLAGSRGPPGGATGEIQGDKVETRGGDSVLSSPMHRFGVFILFNP